MNLDLLRADVKVALRSLRRDPRYALVVIITLALGISADTVIFSVMNPYLVRDLQFQDSDRLYQLGHIDEVNNWDMARFSQAQVDDLRQQSSAFEEMGSYRYSKRNLSDHGDAEQIMAGFMSGNLFQILGMQPILGRTLLAAEEGSTAPRVGVISEILWQRRYGGRADIIGTVVNISSEPYEIVGVMPKEFDFPFGEIRVWLPLPDDPDPTARDEQWYHIVGRLRADATPADARAELNGIHQRLALAHPNEDGQYSGISVVPLRKALNFAYDILQYSFYTLLAAVTLLLLLACVNVASLTLARSTSRSREVAIRAAVGADRGRLVTQLFVEGLVLALASCASGIGISVVVLRIVAPVLPAEALFKTGDFTVDFNVMIYAVLVSLLTPLIFSLMPALRATRRDLFAGLREGTSGGVGAIRSRRALVVVETAIAILLVSGAGVAIQGLGNAVKTDVGFDHTKILSVEIALPESEYSTDEEVNQFFENASRALESSPGILDVGRVARLPFNHETGSTAMALPDAIPSDSQDLAVAEYNSVSPAYFEAIGMNLEAGRFFNAADVENPLSSVIISRSIADRFWGGRSPVGESLMIGAREELRPVTVVGVVNDVKTEGLKDPIGGHIYRPIDSRHRQFLVMSVDSSPAAQVSAVRDELRSFASSLPVVVRPMTDVVRESMLQWVITSLFFTTFGGVALLLTTLGIYGVMAYTVARRTREFGIRMAVGATSGHMSRMILVEGLKLTGLGVAIGLAASVALAAIIASLVSGVDAWSIANQIAVVGLFAAVASIASLGPAMRASRCNPQVALRYE